VEQTDLNKLKRGWEVCQERLVPLKQGHWVLRREAVVKTADCGGEKSLKEVINTETETETGGHSQSFHLSFMRMTRKTCQSGTALCQKRPARQHAHTFICALLLPAATLLTTFAAHACFTLPPYGMAKRARL
jgi:hypothetical protein